MCKIVVYSQGPGGEAFAEMVERELSVMDVIKVADEWLEFAGRGISLKRRVEELLLPYIEKVDVIVLASYDATVAVLKHLRIKYPEQKFIGMSWPVIRDKDATTVVLTTETVAGSWALKRLKRRLPGRVVVEGCEDLNEQKIRQLGRKFKWLKPKNVILGSVELLMVGDIIEEIYRGARVVDGCHATLKNLCKVLNIKAAVRVEKW